MRRGFTLIELLVVVAVVAAMLGAVVLSVASGSQSARLRNAVRGVKQYSRHARAMALLRQAPYVVTVSEVWNGGVFEKSRIEVKGTSAASAAGAAGGSAMMDVTGKYVGGEDGGEPAETMSALANLGEDPKEYEGIRIKVEMLADDGRSKQREKAGISVFSNVDFLRGQTSTAKSADDNEDEKRDGAEEEARDPVSVIYETNGRCRPYLVTVYAEGKDEESGRKIRFDRFGGVHEEEDKK